MGDRPCPTLAYLVFFCSGAAALVYEVSWARQVGLLLGHTAHAAAVVLAAYFAGLAVGYAVGARLARRLDPPVGYALAEFLAAGWAFVLPAVLSLSITRPAGGFVLDWAFCFVVLLPATASLGATLPLLAAWVAPGTAAPGDRVTVAYACNTAGAVVGTVGTTAWLLVAVGVVASGYVAAGVSAGCGLAALALRRAGSNPVPHSVPAPSALTPAWALFAAAASGFGILALEVLYARLFSLVLHNSTYTFGAVLTAAILALALGPLLARALRRMPAREAVGLAAGCGAALVVASVALFASLTRLEYLRVGGGFVGYLAVVSALAGVIIVPPLAALGMILPALWRDGPADLPGHVGRTAWVNALGGAAGAAAASLVLLPTAGLWGSFVLVGLLFATLSVALLASRRWAWATALGAAAVVAALPVAIPPGPERWATPGAEALIARWHSAYGWIDVVEGTDGARKVRQNLHYRFGSTGADAARTYRQAHLPLVLHPRPAEVLFLGLGTGMTAGAAIPHAEVERVVAVELIPEVVAAARLLADANFGVADHAKVEVVLDDARRYVATADRRFDVIVADLFVPWESETGYLYTVEHFRAARRRLNPGGLYCQWLPLYQLGPREFELIADSFAAVFPDVSLWWGHLDARRPILALVGGDGPPRIDGKEVDARLRRVYGSAPIDEEMKTAGAVAGLYAGQWASRRPGFLNTDEYPRVEFLTPVSEGDRSLLQGDALRGYFDDVLFHLPEREGPFPIPVGTPAARRGWHRLVLFPQ